MRHEKSAFGVTDSVSSKIARALSWVAKKRFSGFTLAELIVVITILAILATIGFLALSGYSQDAKDSATKANVRSVQTAIASESAISNNSPRYYIVHDTGAALSGALVYVDGNQTALTGWDWNASGTNYSAGNPDYVKLKMNPEKFKTASSGIPSAFAAYDPKYLSVGAMDAVLSIVNGKRRSVSYFQVAGISPATGAVSVSGTYPTSSGSVSGLVRDPGAGSSTGALIDGTKSGSLPSCAVGYAWDFGTSSCLPTFVSAAWGTVTTATVGGVNYKIHTFTAVGTSTFQVTTAPAGAKIEYLIVAWGGGGGSSGANYCGGGGAGWLLRGTGATVTATSYSIVVGWGGAAQTNGQNSSAFGLTAIGGGAGTSSYGGTGNAGWSGGGGGPVNGIGGAGTAGQGNIGWNASSANQWGSDSGAGAGGWAGGPGDYVGAFPFSNSSTIGWPGIQSDISGTNSWYAIGWGGAWYYIGLRQQWLAGWTPGVNGVSWPYVGVDQNGTPNTGCGGGGGRSGAGGSGGSGIVIVRYQIP